MKIDLSHEYMKIGNAFNLSMRNMFDLSQRSIGNIFDKSEKTTTNLEELFRVFESENF